MAEDEDLTFVAECTGHDTSTCSVLLTAAGGDVDRAVALHFQAEEAKETLAPRLEVSDGEEFICGAYVPTAEKLHGDTIWERELGGALLMRGPAGQWLIDGAENKHQLINGSISGVARSASCSDPPHLAAWEGAVVTLSGETSIATRQACREISPAVHLWWGPWSGHWPQPRIVWFYNEVTVQKSFPATYFMACGWRNGYFGIQDHGPEKGGMVLFSVWDHVSSASPHFGNQDPEKVNEEDRTEILATGEGVTAQRFGGEGTGGQSFFPYNWRIGQTCRCLVRCEELDGGSRAVFSGFFHVPEEGIWRLLASFRVRVPIDQGASLSGPYSFIEDWADNGCRRSGLWGPAWARGPEGEWQQLRGIQVTTTHNHAHGSRSAFLSGSRAGMLSGGELLPASSMGPFVLPASELPEILRDFALPERDGAQAAQDDPAVLAALPLPTMQVACEEAGSLEDTTILAASKWRVSFDNGFINVYKFSVDMGSVTVETRDPEGGTGIAEMTTVDGSEALDGYAWKLSGHYASCKYDLVKFTGGRLYVRHWAGSCFIEGTGSRLCDM